eukprot:9808-Heterococcus_DN1.PRE.1
MRVAAQLYKHHTVCCSACIKQQQATLSLTMYSCVLTSHSFHAASSALFAELLLFLLHKAQTSGDDSSDDGDADSVPKESSQQQPAPARRRAAPAPAAAAARRGAYTAHLTHHAAVTLPDVVLLARRALIC